MTNSSTSTSKLILALLILLVTIAGVSAQCQTTSVTSANVATFAINQNRDIPNMAPQTIKEGESFTVRTILGFKTGTPTESLRFEVGMYPAGSPQQLLSITSFADGMDANPTQNCVAGERNVDTAAVTSGSGGEANIDFHITAPIDASLNGGGQRQYILQAVLFKNCYAECGTATGSQPIKWISIPITLQDNPSLSANSATDGVKNGNETDMDCGGDSGTGCNAGFRCSSAADCRSGLACDSLGSGLAPVCHQPDAPKVSSSFAVGGWPLIIVGLIIVLLAVGIYFRPGKRR